MKLEVKRNEIQFIINGLSQLKGMKDWKKAIALGDDIRTLRKVQHETEEAAKLCKPENYDDLAALFQARCKQKAAEMEEHEDMLFSESEIGTHVMLKWDRSVEWTESNKNYQAAINALSIQRVEIELQTENLTEKDFDKKSLDSSLAEVLSYFQ